METTTISRRLSHRVPALFISLLLVSFPVFAQESRAFTEKLAALKASSDLHDGITIDRSAHNGLVTAIAVKPGATMTWRPSTSAAANANDRALAFVDDHAALFGLRGSRDVVITGTRSADETGTERVRMQQMVDGIPVTGSYLYVHFKGNAVTRAFARTSPGAVKINTQPDVAAADAANSAHGLVKKLYKLEDVQMSKPRLEILDRAILEGRRTGPPRLAWFVEVTRTDVREYVWVDAKMSSILLNFSQLAHAKSRTIYDANGGGTLPGTLVRVEGGAATGDPDSDLAYTYSGNTYDYFFAQHGRDSYDGAGATLISTVDYCPGGVCPYDNAFWNGLQMVYGPGFAAADDVAAHELTHAVTDYSANLFYYRQSGALNESMSDIFGEVVDLTNGLGNDSTGARWLMGEDVAGGAIRNMMDPNAFGDPARVLDPAVICASGDNGGVHGNSGIPNHAFALMTDGGTYNGITVTGIGITKSAKIMYRVLTEYLGPSSDFRDFYTATNAACADLTGMFSISELNCGEVRDALLAVELDQSLADICNANLPPEPEMCDIGGANIFASDGFEVLSGVWTTSVLSGTDNHWTRYGYGTPAVSHTFMPYEGAFSAFGEGIGLAAESEIRMASPVLLPTNARLQFHHSYDFEFGYDGGVVEYSTDGGTTWIDAGSLISGGAPYVSNVTIGGVPRPAFTGASFQYTQTQMNLSAFAGQNFLLRFRVKTDSSVSRMGWFIDNIRFYRCVPQVSVQDVTVYERDTTNSTASVRVALSAASSDTINVNYTTVAGTAADGVDFTGTAGTLWFAPGETSKLIPITILGDLIDEPDEKFTVLLTAPGNAALGRTVGEVLLRDNDVVGLSLGDFSITEADSGTKAAVFTISLSGPSSQTVTVNFETIAQTATAGSDYTVFNQLISIAPGLTSKTVTVLTLGDTNDEPNETFLGRLTNPTNAVITDTHGQCTIIDNDPPKLSISNATVTEGDSGYVNATFTVSLSSPHTATVTVVANTANGSATAGSDYTALSGISMTFWAGTTTKTINVRVLGDLTQEPTETFFVNLSSATGAAILDGQGIGTINDNDQPKVSVNDVSVNEGNSGSLNAVFQVSLSRAPSASVTVNYATANGTATAGADYSARSGTLTFAPGVTTMNVNVPVIGDTVDEADETILFNLSSVSANATLLDGQGVGTIVDNDGPTISLSDVAITEGDASTVAGFVLTLSAPSVQTVSVTFFTSNGTALAGTDYTARSGVVVTWSPGQTSKIVNVTIAGDTVDEGNETFNGNLSSPVGATIADGTGVCTITDNDPPSISIGNVSVTEHDSLDVQANLTLTLSSASTSTVTVNLATSPGTATAGVDYASRTWSITFSPGQTSKVAAVTIKPDLIDEPNETLFVNLSGASNATLATSQAQITIIDED